MPPSRRCSTATTRSKGPGRAPARYAPLFLRTDEGAVLAQDWAAGFLAAVRLRLEAWRPLLNGPAWMGLLLPILVRTPTRRSRPGSPGCRPRRGTTWPRLPPYPDRGGGPSRAFPARPARCRHNLSPGSIELAWGADGDPQGAVTLHATLGRSFALGPGLRHSRERRFRAEEFHLLGRGHASE